MNINKLFKKDFIKNILTLLSGSVLGQAIVYLSVPILTRLFFEEAFGLLALYSSSVLILKSLATLRYELSILLPKRDKDAINLLAFNVIIVAIISLLLFIIVVFFRKSIISILGIQEIGYFIYFVPVSIFFVGNIAAFSYWNNRMNSFKNISVGLVVKSVTMSSSQLSTGFISLNSVGLVPGMILGQLANMVVVVKLSFKDILKFKKFISIKRMLFLASKYKDIPIFNMILSFTNILSNEMPVLLITRYFGLNPAGIYGLAIKVAKAPPGMIGQSITQVFFNKASKVYNEGGNLLKLIKETYKNLFFTALVIFIPLFGISFFIDFIFGENWTEVGLYVRVLIPWLFIGFLSSPVSSLIVILNKQKVILFFDLLLLISRFLVIYIGYAWYNDILISLIGFSSVGVIFNIIMLLYFFRITKQSTNQKKAYK